MLRWPRALKRGDRIRIVAPASGFRTERFEAGIACLRNAGFEPVYDDGLFARYRYMAGTDAQRLAALQQALADDSVRALWTARGGYGCTRLLPHLDPETIADKWLIGFSDVTAMHALWQRAGRGSIHGPNVTTLTDWSDTARARLWRLLSDGGAELYTGAALLGRGRATGRLFGGNLTVLAALAGTPYWPRLNGHLLLLEDVDEKPYEIDRALTHLLQTGALNDVSGVAVGMLSYEKVKLQSDDAKPIDYSPYDVVAEVLAPLGVPMVAQLPIGHHLASEPITLGAEAVLDAGDGTLRVGAISRPG